jgi:glyoxylase-like metal-dependent hydrolase (beta-lactamase superfamily II)
VFVHEAEASFLSGVDPFPNPFQQPWMARAADRVMTMLHPAPVAEPLALRHNDVLPVFGGLRVIHAPGHTPGSICLLVEQNRLLFAGDVMEYRRGALCEPSPRFTHDPSEARRSIELLAGLAVETILLSHFRPVHRARAKLRRLIDGWGD